MNEQTIQYAFEQQIRQYAHNTAIECQNRSFTYAQTDAASNDLAWLLRHLGGGRDVVVKVYMSSCAELVIGMLGIFRSGSIFLPLSLSFSEKRLTHIFAQFPAGIIITTPAMAEQLKEQISSLGLPVTCLVLLNNGYIHAVERYSDDGWTLQGPVTIPEERFPDKTDPEDGCYVYFTSGTTGNGRAVLGRHKSLHHFIGWEKKEFCVGPGSRVSQLMHIAFDPFLRDVFVPLCSGATLCIPPEDARHNMTKLVDWLSSSGITLMHIVPTVFRLLTKELDGHRDKKSLFDSLQYILLAGEILYAKDIINWRSRIDRPVEFVNMYGPTEVTLVKCFHLVKELPGNPAAVVPIGKPISNTSIAIFNHDIPCEIGEVGEIYIRTPYLSKGYLNDPEANARVFIQNPLVTDRKDIVYRTGDLGRFMSDRTIEILGRVDNQVKVNGIRIELGEVEQAVLGNGQVTQTVVIVHKREDRPDELICYYTGQLTPDELRSYLVKELNVNIIPAHFIRLEAFPTNINGKVDRRALPRPETFAQDDLYEPAENDMEEKIEAIWKDVLEVPRIGRRTPFFRAGGTSTKAIQVISRIYRDLAVSIKVAEMFTSNTIETLATLVTRAATKTYDRIMPMEEQDHYPVSHAQKRIWIIHQFPGKKDIYALSGAYLLHGSLDVSAFKQAWRHMLGRHESLRTVFVTADGEPRQSIRDAGDPTFDLFYKDCRNDLTNSAVAREHMRRQVAEWQAMSFDLANGPLVRVQLLRLNDPGHTGQTAHVFVFSIHHIISDGWSLDILINDLMASYNLIIQDIAALHPLPIQYKDYVAWQQQQFGKPAYKLAESYWQDRFKGEVPVLRLPEDFSRPPVKTYRGAYLDFTVDTDLRRRMESFCHQKDITLFTLLLAAVNALLYKYSGQHDIIVGSPLFGREREEFEGQTGLYINTLALRTHFDPDASFDELLVAVKETILQGFEHSLYPFDELVVRLDAKRDWSRSPLFDVWVVLQNPGTSGSRAQRIEGLSVEDFNRDVQVSLHDLSFNFHETDELLSTIVYNPALFDSDTIRALSRQLLNILDAVTQESSIPVRRLRYLSGFDLSALESLAATASAESSHGTIVQRFEEVALQYPERSAVHYQDVTMTYRELNDKANSLAAYIRQHCGNDPHPVVALLLDRSADIPVAMLAALKAGGAFLPVNTLDPAERIAAILRDAMPAIVLTHVRGLEKLEGYEGEIFAMDVEMQHLPSDPVNPLPAANEDDLAYIIYTSGSTGVPKGSLVSHSAMVNLIEGLSREYLPFERPLKIAVVAPYVFDPFGKQVFLALLGAHSLYIVPDDLKLAGDLLWSFYIANGIDQTDGTPALLQILVNDLPEPGRQGPPSHFWVGGSALPSSAVGKLFHFYEENGWGIDMINEYGLTECCVDNTCYRVTPEALARYDILPVGRPLPGNGIYILDNRLEPVARGVVGEICIGGAGLGRGYLNRPELTVDRFVHYTDRHGAVLRLYRTGDLGKWLPDGNLAYIGRSDDQVKVRGYRIELAEVESRFRKLGGVQDACVVLWQDQGDAALAGYYTSKDDLSIAALKAGLGRFLPSYMIPDHIIRIKEFPLTVNGKINKKALPLPTEQRKTMDNAYEVPVTEVETRLAAIWQEVLGKDRIGIDDNFFEIGGHSLKAVQIASRIFQEMRVRTEVATLFGNPTIRLLAQAVAEAPSDRQNTIAPVEEQQHYEASHSQKRFWILNEQFTFNIFGAYLLTGPLRPDIFARATETFMRRHQILRTTLFQTENSLRQKVSGYRQAGLGMTIVDLSGEPDAEGEVLRRSDRARTLTFDLSSGPLVRAELLHIRPSKYIFLFSMHHSIADGPSLEIASREIFRYYKSWAAGQDPAPAPLPLQYKDYAAWQHTLLRSEAGNRHRNWWLARFADYSHTAELPHDYPRPLVRSDRSAGSTFEIPHDLYLALKRFAVGENTSLFSILLTIVKALIYRYTGDPDVVVGTTVSNRNEKSLEDQIGYYVDVLPLRTIAAHDDTFTTFCRKVKASLLGAYEHQAYPFDLLVETLKVKRNAHRSPLFDVLVQLTGVEENAGTAPQPDNIRITTLSSGQQEGFLDLMFLFTDETAGCFVTLQYDTGLFREETIERFLDDWMTLARSAAATGSERLADIVLQESGHEQAAFDNFTRTIL